MRRAGRGGVAAHPGPVTVGYHHNLPVPASPDRLQGQRSRRWSCRSRSGTGRSGCWPAGGPRGRGRPGPPGRRADPVPPLELLDRGAVRIGLATVHCDRSERTELCQVLLYVALPLPPAGNRCCSAWAWVSASRMRRPSRTGTASPTVIATARAPPSPPTPTGPARALRSPPSRPRRSPARIHPVRPRHAAARTRTHRRRTRRQPRRGRGALGIRNAPGAYPWRCRRSEDAQETPTWLRPADPACPVRYLVFDPDVRCRTGGSGWVARLRWL